MPIPTAYLPITDVVITTGEQKTLWLLLVDEHEVAINLTGKTLEAVLVNPSGAVSSPSVTIEDQDDAPGYCSFTIASGATMAGDWYVRFNMDSEPVCPRGKVGFHIKGYDPIEGV